MRRIVAGQKEAVAAWMVQRLPQLQLWCPYEAIGFTDASGRLIGAVLYDNFIGFNIEIHVAGEGCWLSRENLAATFGYPFLQLGCRRITARVSARNGRAARLCSRVGFKLEGICREAFADGSDLLVFGMLRRECRWINVRQAHGQKLAS